MTDVQSVQVDEVNSLTANGALLLDVRETEEFESGHAPQAVHVALSDVPDHLGDFDSNQLIVCVCRSGGRSGRAAKFLAEQGYLVANCEGGRLAWAEAGLDMVAHAGEPFVQ